MQARFPVVVLTVRHAALALECLAWLAGYVVDRTRECRATVLRGLRSLDHLDALEIGDLGRYRSATQIHAVDEEGSVRATDDVRLSADHGAFGGGASERCRIRQARREAGEITDVLDGALFKHRRGDRRDRKRHVLQTLFALACGDDDFLESAAVGRDCSGGGVLRRRRLGGENQGDSRDDLAVAGKQQLSHLDPLQMVREFSAKSFNIGHILRKDWTGVNCAGGASAYVAFRPRQIVFERGQFIMPS